MTLAQLWSRRHHWPWADIIRADFQTCISRYLHNVNTRLFCTADRMFRTIIMQNSRLIYACFPIKIDKVWIDRFCVRYDWWHRLQPTSSVSPVYSWAPSHYLNQCSLIISEVLWPSTESNRMSQEILKISILDMNLNINDLRLQPHLPCANAGL